MKLQGPVAQGRVLIVDDQKNWRDTIGELLSSDGHKVQTASSLAEAEEYVCEESFDVVILDIRLIDENRYDAQGLELLEAIKECRRKVRALVLTGYPTPEIETRAKEMGATETVFKSPSEGLNIVRFRRLVRELIRGSDS